MATVESDRCFVRWDENDAATADIYAMLANQRDPPHRWGNAGDAGDQLHKLRRTAAAFMPQARNQVADALITLACKGMWT